MKKLLLILLCLPLISLAQQTYVTNDNIKQHRQTYKDSFSNNIKSFWQKQLVDNSRLSIVTDPFKKENDVLKIEHNMTDYIYLGFRSELKIPPQYSIGDTLYYSFKFLFPDSFFQIRENNIREWIIIHQWHAQNDKNNLTPDTINIAPSEPPVSLVINNDYHLLLRVGLKSKKYKSIYTMYEEKLIPNKWYTFECDIFFSLNNNGYVEAKLNGEHFRGQDGFNRIYARNMYNILPNYFKMGLYRSEGGSMKRTILFDDFYLESRR